MFFPIFLKTEDKTSKLLERKFCPRSTFSNITSALFPLRCKPQHSEAIKSHKTVSETLWNFPDFLPASSLYDCWDYYLCNISYRFLQATAFLRKLTGPNRRKRRILFDLIMYMDWKCVLILKHFGCFQFYLYTLLAWE